MQEMITGPAGELELLMTPPATADPAYVGICCHPHPLQSGTMHNKVVTTTAKAFQRFGFPTLRFNFRGVGNSAGAFADAIGESDDLLAVIAFAKAQYPTAALCLAGFSFGSYVAARVANTVHPALLVSVAPPVNHYDFGALTQLHCPWLVVQGDQDEVVPYAEVAAFAAHPPAPMTFVTLPNVGHFFHGQLISLREIMEKYLAQTLGISPL